MTVDDERVRRGSPIPATTGPVPTDELLLHADLHNHTRLSDGEGRAEEAYASMRRAGLDVAAVTDHTYGACEPDKTIDHAGWRLLGELADVADDAGRFVTMRGFEWSSSAFGHMNVWGSRGWVAPAQPGTATAAAVGELHEWLASHPDAMTDDGGPPLLSFNHPGREPDAFDGFRFDPRLAPNLVALEMFNRGDDYLFEGVDRGLVSPLVACLGAGWRPGLIGVTDEHGPHWGFPTGLGRTGIWAPGRTRSGLRTALLRRRTFATRERDVDLDADVDGIPMGATVRRPGRLRVRLRVDGPGLRGRRLRLQCLTEGQPLPRVALEFDLTVDGYPVRFELPDSEVAGPWLVLRLTDPTRPADPRSGDRAAYRDAGSAVAYLSPFHLD